MTVPTTVLEVHDVHKAYARGGTVTNVLGGVNLTVQRGECVFLVGPSGSGKSTLLSILGCILTPDRGRLRILGRDVAHMDGRVRTLIRRDVLGFVFQRFQLIRGLSVLENVLVPLRLQGRPLPEARQRASELLDAVGLAQCRHARPNGLSAGQCQRVAFARALANNPLIILADEPTASLDAVTGDEVMQVLRNLTTQYQKTAIVVTHDPRIFKYADRIYNLEDGHLTEHRTQNAECRMQNAECRMQNAEC